MTTIDLMAATLAPAVSGISHNHYTLTLASLQPNPILSVRSLQGEEQLNQPWRYPLIFTCADKHLAIDTVLNQAASLTFNAPSLFEPVRQISCRNPPAQSSTLYGINTNSPSASGRGCAGYRSLPLKNESNYNNNSGSESYA